MQGVKITPETEEKIRDYLKGGKSNRWIMQRLGISESPIKRILKEGAEKSQKETESSSFTPKQIAQWNHVNKRYGRGNRNGNER